MRLPMCEKSLSLSQSPWPPVSLVVGGNRAVGKDQWTRRRARSLEMEIGIVGKTEVRLHKKYRRCTGRGAESTQSDPGIGRLDG